MMVIAIGPQKTLPRQRDHAEDGGGAVSTTGRARRTVASTMAR